MANVKDLLVNGSARVIGTIYGNATSANKVNNKLTIKLNTGTTEGTNLYTFDGSAAKTLDIKSGTGLAFTAAAGSLTIKHSNSVTAGTAQGDANKTLTFGGTFTIPTVTYDAQGHITGKGTTTMTMPANPDTWRGIQNNLTSDSTTDSLSAAQGKVLKGLIDGKAASNHTHNYLPLSGGTMTGSPVIKFPASAGTIATSDPMAITYGRISAYGNLFINANTDNSGTEYVVLTAGKGLSSSTSDGLAVGTSTLTWLGNTVIHSGNYTSYTVTKTGSGASGTWGINITGNAATATKLQTARSINGTNFDGSSNITTANWGTSRTLTIGNKAQSVNGSSNVTWTLDDIGASDRYLLRNNHVSFTVDGDADTYYPVLISAGHNNTYGWDLVHITRGYRATAPDTWNTSTHRGGLTLTLRWAGDTSWGGNDKTIVVEEFQESYSTMVGGLALSSNGLIVWLRGGGAVYHLGTAYGKAASATVYLTDYTASNKAVFSPRSYNADTVNSEVKGKWYLRQNQFYGNAATATKLATTRTIALTGSVTGSGTFDGSGNLSITTTTNHTHNYAGSASSGGSATSAVKLDTATAGSATQPVYFSGGKPAACTYTLGKSVPSDAKFTDTTYSAGTGLSLSGTTFNHKNSVTAATAQGDASKTLTFGGTFTIPTVTYDAQGHITAKGTTTMTMPANPNTDTKVTQTVTTSNATYPLLLAPSGQTATTITTSYFDSGVTLNPSTNTIAANISGNAATATKLATVRTIWGQSFNGTANITGNLSDMGGQLRLLSGQDRFSFYTSDLGAAWGSFKGLYLSDSYANTTTHRLYVNGTTYIQSNGSSSTTNGLTINNGVLAVTNYSQTLTVGALNGDWTHLETSGSRFYFNKQVHIDGDLTRYSYNSNGYGTISGYNLAGNANSATNADTVDNLHANSFLRKYNTNSEVGNTDEFKAGSYIFTHGDAGEGNWPTGTLPPGAHNGTVILHTHTHAGNYYTQLALDTNQNTLWIRSANNVTTFGGWTRIWKQGDAVTGAVWNDYAEYREADTIQGGRCVREVGDDTLALTTKRLMRGCSITSDTWGFAQGETDKAKTPIAVAGRVLAYPYEDRELFKEYIGYSVCSGPDGTVSLMTEEEELKYPWAIVGTVSAVPDYEEWGGGEMADRPSVKVDGRIWIKVK